MSGKGSRHMKFDDLWLRYARSVIACGDEHKADCVKLGGAGPGDIIDHDLRWPGMLGPNYANAKPKILCIGQIHLADEWTEKRFNLGCLQPLMHEWLQGLISDEKFRSEYNEKYAQLLPLWGPWVKGFGPVLRRFGIRSQDVVYANFARCWQRANLRVYDAIGLYLCVANTLAAVVLVVNRIYMIPRN
jgi:hypothetical protein